MRGALENTSLRARGGDAVRLERQCSASDGVLRRLHSSSIGRGTAHGDAWLTASQLGRGCGARLSCDQSAQSRSFVRRSESIRAAVPASGGFCKELSASAECRRFGWLCTFAVPRGSGGGPLRGELTGDGSGDLGCTALLPRLGARCDTLRSLACETLDGIGCNLIESGRSTDIESGDSKRVCASKDALCAIVFGDDPCVDHDPELAWPRATGLAGWDSIAPQNRRPESWSRIRGDMLTSEPIAATRPGSTPSGPPTGELHTGSTNPAECARLWSGMRQGRVRSRVGLEGRSGTAGGPMLPGGVTRRGMRDDRGTLVDSAPL